MKKLVMLLVMLVLFGSFASAITGSIGNARMILREFNNKDIEVGDIIERTILVKNVNDVSVDIELFASGDLADDTTVIDDKFTLGSGEERKARFKITVTESGTTETNINVKFTPDEGSGVGLTSTVIIIAKDNSFWSNLFDGDDEDDDVGDESDNAPITGQVTGDGSGENPALIIVIVAAIVFLILLIILLLVMINNKKKVVKTKPQKRVKGRHA